jgi:hypothetical protein
MRRFFLCSQNNDSKNYGFIQSVFSDFVATEFPKTPSPKPARIPPQTPPAGGNTAEAGRIHSPRQIVSPCRVRFNHLDFARNSFELCPTSTARIRNSNLGQKYGRREAPSVLHSPPQNPDSARIRHAPRGSSFANTML